MHSISHMVGAEFDTHHGLTNAIALPAVLRFNAPDIADKVPAMSRALGLDGTDFETFYQGICDCSTDLRFRNLSQRSVCRWMPRGASPRKPIWMRPQALIHDPPT